MSRGGTSSQVWLRGVPHPMSGGGLPVPCLGGMGGNLISDPGGVPHLRSGGVPRPDLGWGIPPGQTWDAVPPWGQTWDGVPSPYHPDLDGVPPPRNVNRQTPVKTVPSRHTTYAGGNKLANNLGLYKHGQHI